MQLSSLHDLFVAEIKDLYSAETQLREGFAENGQGGSVQGAEERL